MERQFDLDLGQLKQKLLAMAGLATSNISMAIRALVERNEKYTSQILSQEEQINSLQMEIDNYCLELIARWQPVAADLRFLVSAIKINSELERIGDLASNINEATIRLLTEPKLKPLIDIPRMAEIAQKMVNDAIDSFVKKDSHLAQTVLTRDDTVDNYRDQIFRELLTYMLQDQTTTPRALQLILISRSLERVADHSTNIAEDVIYLVEGVDIRHHIERK
ncbi:MAG: phosphate signaling complex protein PhoU [candidate division Zixibacteria bacterium]|nr:phosphate signaling complex protein PhoU [candidate division Zixibacteria bacterium]